MLVVFFTVMKYGWQSHGVGHMAVTWRSHGGHMVVSQRSLTRWSLLDGHSTITRRLLGDYSEITRRSITYLFLFVNNPKAMPGFSNIHHRQAMSYQPAHQQQLFALHFTHKVSHFTQTSVFLALCVVVKPFSPQSKKVMVLDEN